MPNTPTAAFLDALTAHLETFAAAQSPELAVSYPDVDFDGPDDVPYLEALFLPNRTDTRSLSTNGSQRHEGLLQVCVMWPRARNAPIDGHELAGEVEAYFAKGTTLTSGAFQLRIDRAPWVSAYLQEPTRLRIPVTIPYVAFASGAVAGSP